jgi:calcineurin-like phosphoesterase family protein
MKTPTIWFIADTHFGHKNIINYENRPFNNIEEMDEAIISNWNSVVDKEDIIYHLGDFAFSHNKEELKILLERLNGRKVLIMGNHDLHINKYTDFWREVGFEEVYRYPIIYDDFFMLSHEPLYLNNNTPYRQIHGHIHSGIMTPNLYYNACVEHTNYYPVKFEDIKNYFIKNSE